MARIDDVPRSYMTVGEVAALRARPTSTVRRWAVTGRLPAKKVGRQWLIDVGPAPVALDVGRIERALRATGALWSSNDYYEATVDAAEFARAIVDADIELRAHEESPS